MVCAVVAGQSESLDVSQMSAQVEPLSLLYCHLVMLAVLDAVHSRVISCPVASEPTTKSACPTPFARCLACHLVMVELLGPVQVSVVWTLPPAAAKLAGLAGTV